MEYTADNVVTLARATMAFSAKRFSFADDKMDYSREWNTC